MSQKIKLAERVISASRAARVAKASRFGIMISAILTFLIFAISYYGEVVGNFTVAVERPAQNAGLTLYENYIDREMTSKLLVEQLEDMGGMTAYCGTEFSKYREGDGVCIPSDEELASVDGSNNGNSYIAYTFYVENAGNATVDISATMNLISQSQGAENALRVRIIVDGVGVTHALRQSERGEEPGELEPLCEDFYSPTVVSYQEFTLFEPGDVIKVTIVVWYEGEDADHTISLMGGGIKLDMDIEIIQIYTDDDL